MVLWEKTEKQSHLFIARANMLQTSVRKFFSSKGVVLNKTERLLEVQSYVIRLWGNSCSMQYC